MFICTSNSPVPVQIISILDQTYCVSSPTCGKCLTVDPACTWCTDEVCKHEYIRAVGMEIKFKGTFG